MARFSFGVGEQLLALQQALRDETWRPGPYTHFTISEPKQRLISAAPFADRVQALARRHRWVLRLDVVKHFPSLDHAILRELLWRRVPELGLRRIIDLILASGAGILASGAGIHDNAPDGPLLPGDDLLALCRPRGLPIGNLTSQFWSNVFMDPLDKFVLRGLRCGAYVRYVDDLALFGDDRAQLLDWRDRVIDFLAQRLRLRVHEGSAQVQACADGIPWLGFVVSPHRRRVKSRKVVEATRHLVRRHAA